MLLACLNSDERARLEEIRRTDRFVDETLRQCQRILESSQFERVQERMVGFLGFVVGKKLLGYESDIKEVIIAIHVFHAPADYNSAENARVRVAAGSLRA